MYVRTTPEKMARVQLALDSLMNGGAPASSSNPPANTGPILTERVEPQNVILSNGNSTVMLNRTAAAAGMDNWTGDGNGQIHSESFYYSTRTSSNWPSASAPAASRNQTGSVVAGTNATFTVAATGTAPLSYQWVFNGANIAGATHEKPHINIKVKFVEGEASTNSSAFSWFMPDSWVTFETNSTLPPRFVSPYILKGSNSITRSELSVTNSIISQGTAILNDRSLAMVMNALAQRDGVDILTTPEFTTVDNRPAQIQMLDMMTVVLGMSAASADQKTNPHPLTEVLGFGPTFDVVAKVSDDGFSVKLKMSGSIAEFKGYTKAKTPTPQISGQKLEAEATVPDGHTIVLAGQGPVTTVVVKDKVPVLGSIPLLGRLFQTKSTSTVRKDLLVFVTPTLINADGTPYHPKADSHGQSPSAPPSASRDEAKKTN